MMNSNPEEKIHLNDLSFIHFCKEKYGVNRGVYNTIDAWFYDQGVVNILERRHYILSFLDSLNGMQMTEGSRPKFGNGGLTIKLREYFFRRDEKIISNMASNL
ncbi:hypothetical protein RRV45_01700 [Bacillus sp. DTU_2020_1000418_1_SI_GHA_SEK_038]|uniref:hypothetical protein n=1 Tax=Bacillus sp. DTU_2020_1000418_1_SI_GHA_SEK_038 TaxID=3077585 RepID=UPI0028EFE131|nr:hypothetical protein [Bacillus sp. DTU_2020_1000418_1_SI_GHA_SEK_038]WNS75790.1 hypothetical protein RRV45_01700 [Bacillus sp. DTU_2020_1000418_1_SI_GHA_SEK_038]